jgi:hypothetical protein
MSLITEQIRISDVLLFEAGEDLNYTRDAITVVSGTAASVTGQVLGPISLGAATSAVKASGANTGVGTLVVDVTTPVLAFAVAGLYTVRVSAVGTFIVTDPKGVILGTVAYGAGATVTFADRIKFAFHDDVTTHFIIGDGFDVTIAAGSNKYAQVAPAAADGSQNAAGVLLVYANASAGDVTAIAVTRGPAILKANGLTWTAGMTSGQKTAALAQLQALGILNRQDYGV